MLLLGVVLPYIGLGNEFIGRDEAYQALCVKYYASSPLAMMVFYAGNVWTGIFGDDILSLRHLMVICYQFSIAVSCAYLYYRTRHLLLSSVLFLTMCLGFRYVAMALYGWDSGAYPSMTLFTVTTLIYISAPSVKNVAILGITTGLMVVSRIPTIAALPFIFGIIIYSHRDNREKRLRAIALDCTIGLFSFFVTFLALVALMTCGHIDNYTDAWVPDNIINGHFDSDMLIWRWKDVTRRVITAFYPMMLCFAMACYMVRVRRFLKFNAVICALVCSIMSFYFFKTYRLYDEYAAGIYESFFLVVLLLPLLYNMTHATPVKIKAFPMVAILFCSLLAGIGSDGFLERPMTVSTIPLLFIFTYGRFRVVAKWFLSFALLSVFSMYILMIVSNARHLEIRFDDKPHLTGIKSDTTQGGSVVKRFVMIASVIESLRERGTRFACVGTDRYEFDYVFNDGVEYNLHHFHYFDSEEDIVALESVVGEYDTILIICKTDGSGYPASETYLSGKGYNLIDEGFYFKLFARHGACDIDQQKKKIN